MPTRAIQGLRPTEAGDEIDQQAWRMAEHAYAADRISRDSSAGLTGRLRVCAAVTFARLHLVPRLPEFLAMHPELELDVVLDDRNIDLAQEGIDVALRMGNLPDSSLTARRIARSRRIVVATPAYLAKAGRPQQPGDLETHQAVIYEPSGNAWTFRRSGKQVTVTLRGRMRFNAAEGVRAAVLAHAGLALVSQWMVAPELADGRVAPLLADWQLPPLDLWAVFPAGRTATTKAHAFIAFVETVLAGMHTEPHPG